MAIIEVLSRNEAREERDQVLDELRTSVRTDDREAIRAMLNSGILDDAEVAWARRLRTLDFLLDRA